MKTKTILEKLTGVERDTVSLRDDEHYQSTIDLLLAWDGDDAQALIDELERRARHKPKPEPLDMSNPFDDGVVFINMVNDVAERLRVGVSSPDWKPEQKGEREPMESVTARRLRERFRDGQDS